MGVDFVSGMTGAGVDDPEEQDGHGSAGKRGGEEFQGCKEDAVFVQRIGGRREAE